MNRVVLNLAGFRALRNSQPVIAMLQGHADRIASSAGAGFETRPVETGDRARIAVVTTTYEAMLAEAHGRALTRATGGSSVWRR